MIEIKINGLIKRDENTEEWFVESDSDILVTGDLLAEIDNLLETLDYDMTNENEHIEIIIKLPDRTVEE